MFGTQTKVDGDLEPSKEDDEYVNTANELMAETKDDVSIEGIKQLHFQ